MKTKIIIFMTKLKMNALSRKANRYLRKEDISSFNDTIHELRHYKLKYLLLTDPGSEDAYELFKSRLN